MLATLAIPIPVSLSETEKHLELDENAREKSRRLAGLLALQGVPTRTSLVNDMLKMGVHQHIMPQLQDLYQCLEKDFSPLRLCSRVNSFFEFLQENEELELSQYVKPLQEVAIVRLLKQCRLLQSFRLERAIVDVARSNELQVRIDHRTKAISFGLDLHVAHKEEVPEGPYLQSMPSERLRNQLTLMSTALHNAINKIRPEAIKQKCQEEQQRIVQLYLRSSKKEHKQMLERKAVIEARKEFLESLHVKKEQQEQKMLRLQQKESLEAEKKRLNEERHKREVLRRKQELQDIEKKQAMDKIAALKKTTVGAKALKDLTEEEIEAMDADDILARQVEQLDKEKKELQIRLKTQEKKMDYFARATRVEEIPLLKKQYEEHLVLDKQFWEEQEEERINKAVSEHDKLMETSGRLQRMLPDKDDFVENLSKARQAAHEEKMKEYQKRLDEARKKRMEERRKERILERKAQRKIEKEEKEVKDKEDREIREREEAEESVRKEKEEKEREYREKVARMDEVERKRREREKEIEERQAEPRNRPDTDRDGPYRAMDRDKDRWGPPRRDMKDEKDEKEEPRGGAPWRREGRERPSEGGWRREEPPRERDAPPRERDAPPRERDAPPRERDAPPPSRDEHDSGGAWRRAGDGRDDRFSDDRDRVRDDRSRDDRSRDDRSRDSGPGGAWRRDEPDREGPRDEGSSWRRPGDRDGPPRSDMDRGQDRGRMDDRGPWRRDASDRPPPSAWRDRDSDRDGGPPNAWRGRDDRGRDDRGRDDRGRDDRGRDGWRDDRGRDDDRRRDDRGRDDSGRDDRGRDDRGRDDRGRDEHDKPMAWRGRDRDERDRPSGDSWRGDRGAGDRDDRYRGDREGERFRGGDRDDRSGWRSERSDDRDTWRGRGDGRGDEQSRDQWRRDPPPAARTEGKSYSASRRGREQQQRPPAEQSDPEGWTTVQYK
ncbi:Eukaryotic translation initiation factor 3 subunit A [Desmophyllum pertusum]|uniref:Eukaryotic translation initiation factor 3 subunit A n=1 Tax=Desmophyllum pertusum TaxID=174260 RepID=A0A9W9YA82_9CNID|nr:Eukaryotic translation initiation factor 3 subunit A [Desmophyllum pertusum]